MLWLCVLIYCLSLIRCVELLLKFGAQVDGRSEDEEETLLHIAARLGHVELAYLLLKWGACPDVRNSEGWTPLLAACDARCQSPKDAEATTNRCFQLCHLLLSVGADADAANQDKRPTRTSSDPCIWPAAMVTQLLYSCSCPVVSALMPWTMGDTHLCTVLCLVQLQRWLPALRT